MELAPSTSGPAFAFASRLPRDSAASLRSLLQEKMTDKCLEDPFLQPFLSDAFNAEAYVRR